MGSSLNCKLCMNGNKEHELFTTHSLNNNNYSNDISPSSSPNPHFIKLQNYFSKLKQQETSINAFSENGFVNLFGKVTSNFEQILNDCNEQLDELNPPSSRNTKLPPFELNMLKSNEKEYYDCNIDINNGSLNGKGSYVDDKGNAYRGQFNNNVFDGVGVFVSKFGDYYYGEWKDGVYHGKGEYVNANGCKYKGDFQYGVKHGNGEETYKNGSYYSGEFVNGKKNGYGKLEFPDGSYYEGEFKDDEFDGDGEYQFNDGRFYKGKFSKGKMMGKPVNKGNVGGNGMKQTSWGEHDLVNFE